MRPIAIDKRVLTRRVSRCMPTYEHAAIVQREMAAQLIDELLSASGVDRFDRVLELGCGAGLATGRLLDNCRVRRLILNDLVAGHEKTAQQVCQRTPGLTVRFLPGDMEVVAFPARQDLVLASAVFQWASDLPALLHRVAGLLRPGGLLAMASFGPSNLREISALTGLSLRYWPVAEWRAALAKDWEVLSGTECMRTLWFPSAREVVRHLRQTGVNALSSRPWPRARLMQFCLDYEAMFGADGKVPLTYHPVFLVARKRRAGGLCA